MSTSKTADTCYHCGEPCVEERLIYKEHSFCCTGCRTVFQLLESNDMCEYYDLENRPGTQVKMSDIGDRFAFLDLPEIRKDIIDFSESNTTKVGFFIPNVHCSSCIWLLEHLDRLNEGVTVSKIDFVKKRLTVTYNESKITLRQLVELLTSIGYEPSLSLDDINKKEKTDTYGRDLLIRLAVAGFVFGNVMLLSFPEYLAISSSVEEEFQSVFNWINLGLGSVVMFYPAMVFMRSAWNAVRNRTVNIDVPLAIGILALYFRSVVEIVGQHGVGYMDSLAGLVFFLLIGRWYQDKTYKALSFERDFRSYFPIAVTRVNNGVQEQVALKDITEGDELVIFSNGLVPADAELLSEAASIDYSFVTGESEPVQKQAGDIIYAGGRQVGAAIHIRLQKDVSQSYLTGLWDQDVFKKDGRTLGTMMDAVAQRFTFVVLTISMVATIAWYFIDPSRMLDVFTAILIISCPCGLALTMPFALGNGIRILGRNGLFLRDSATIERLSNITRIIFDKTGTLTTGTDASVDFFGELTDVEKQMIQALVSNSSHPLSRAVAEHLPPSEMEVTDYEEVAFKGVQGSVDGKMIKAGSADWVGLHAKSANLGAKVYVSVDGRQAGYFVIAKRYRNGLLNMMNELKRQFKLEILSGDNDSEGKLLRERFAVEEMAFDQSPFDKMNHVKMRQSQGEKVMMVGDGLNDAGALKTSEVGLSVAENIYAFSPSCDGIYDSRSLTELPNVMAFAKGCMRVVKSSFVISFIYNSIGIALAVQGLVSPVVAAVLMPLSSITVVAFATLGTSLSAKRLGLQ